MESQHNHDTTAIIAGTGVLPIEACRYFSRAKKPFFVVSLFPEENYELLAQEAGVGNVTTPPFYKAATILKLLKKRGTRSVLLIGKVDKNTLLKKIRFDWLALKLLASVLYKNDAALMERLLREFEKHGMQVISQHDILASLTIAPGIVCGRLSKQQKRDVEIGMSAAQIIADATIGQTVVIKHGMVLAVEAIEGTDACIFRGIELGGGSVVICKSTSSNHNDKYDLPTLGLATLEKCKAGDIAVIAWKASHTLIANHDAFVARARKLGITLISMS